MHVRPHPGRPASRRGGARTAFAALLLLSLASCHDPQRVVPGNDADWGGRYANGRLEFRVVSTGGGASSLLLVATSLAYVPATQQLYAQVALRNTGREAVPGPDGIVVHGFSPADVVPQNATCVAADSWLPVPHCTFDHRGTYGDDGVLDAGETSTPVEWILRVPGGESFAFQARLAAGAAAPGTISGIVFEDRDASGRRDAGETGVHGATIVVRSGTAAQSTQSGGDGRFVFQVQEPGLYQVEWEAQQGWRPTSASPLEVVILRRADGSLSRFDRADFGLARTGPGASVTIAGIVFEDLDRNGVHDPSEPGIAGLAVTGKACGRSQDPLPSDGFGRYSIVLPACGGPWSARAASLDGFFRTTPKSVEFAAPPPAGEALRADFGYAREDASSRYSVRGTVYRDDNGNGVRDWGEPPVVGVAVSARGTTCATATAALDHSDERGRYELDGQDVRCPLPWELRRGALPGTRDTTPAERKLDLPPADGETYSIDFGVAPGDSAAAAPAYDIEGVVYIDSNKSGTWDHGEPGVANAELQILGPCRTVRVARTDASGRYRFGRDVVGSCAVTALWQSLPDFEKHTTPNPMLVDPTAAPPSGTLVIDFGVRY